MRMGSPARGSVVSIAGTHQVMGRVKKRKGLARVTGRGSDNRQCEDEEMERRRRRRNVIDTKGIVDKAGGIRWMAMEWVCGVIG